METSQIMLALGGGALIGLSSVILLAMTGRIAGISGIVGALFEKGKKNSQEDFWRWAFVVGLISGGLFTYLVFPQNTGLGFYAHPFQMILAGLIVGIGTRLGSGCTSGHGVCGLARRSKRSVVATLSFMIAGIVTVFFLRQMGFYN